MLFDAFVCHASEDKDDFVRPLVERLRGEHIEVWYDEFSLQVGDSLRRSIDRGLSQSRFGIVVLSPHFFGKQWSQWELDGLVARQNDGEINVLLPIWHGVQRSDVLRFSPPLADKLAASTTDGLDAVVKRLVSVIRPQGSTLVIARDHLLDWGCSPPVISDDWWLDVAAAAESNDAEGDFQESMGWGRWGFPLPPPDRLPSGRGLRMAWAAMQMGWQQEADSRPITQLTHPDVVHEYIESQPGLLETCHEYPQYLMAYAPQLTIRGFGGRYEDTIETLYRHSVAQCEQRRAKGDRHGSALTTDGRHPGCGDEFALRDSEFGCYGAAHVACGFVQGNWIATGPPIIYYDHVDYAAWLLSDASRWLPTPIRDTLTLGMAEWPAWVWTARERRASEVFGFESEAFTGALSEWLDGARPGDVPPPGSAADLDAIHRLQFSARLLRLPENGAVLAQRLLAPEFLGVHLTTRSRRQNSRQRR